MSTRSRRRWTAAEKWQTLEEGRQTGQAISVACPRQQVAPRQFYAWKQQARQGALPTHRHLAVIAAHLYEARMTA